VTSRPLLILNPKAGSVRGKASTEQILRAAEGALGAIDHALTERPRHATELAYEAARSGRSLVIATGGDGSIHEVVNGLMRARDEGHDQTVLGIIGRGTGSDFCKTLGIEPRLDRFLSVIAGGHTRAIDVGAFRFADPPGELAARSAYFVNILSVGMGGLVDRYVHESAS
jgi:diacylglycerol kinase (ATP)